MTLGPGGFARIHRAFGFSFGDKGCARRSQRSRSGGGGRGGDGAARADVVRKLGADSVRRAVGLAATRASARARFADRGVTHGGRILRAPRARGLEMTRTGIIPGVSAVESSLLAAAAVDFGIQFVGWAVASVLKTEKFYDILGSVAFASTAAMTLASSGLGARQVLVSAMAMTWTARLGVFLGLRAHRDGGDSRFDGVKDKPRVFAIYWFLQGVWVWVTSLPVYMVNGTPGQSGLRAADYALAAFWALGFAFELTADVQKYVFKSNKANKGKYIKHGLWSLSRHPNYFGEICMWFGVAGVAASGLAASHPGRAVGVFASPLFVTFLLTQMSGIPILEKSADERWGKDEGYQMYKKTTPVLVPKLPWM